LQELASNGAVLLRSKGVVVNDRGKGIGNPMRSSVSFAPGGTALGWKPRHSKAAPRDDLLYCSLRTKRNTPSST